MNERPKAELHSSPAGIHFQPSKLLVVALVVAAAATGALIITVLVDMPSSTPPPPRPEGSGPPPPPNIQSLAIISIVTGIFVLAWLAVLVIFARDQIIRQLRQPEPTPPPLGREELSALLADLRAEIAGDREQSLRMLGARLEELTGEYGERRETDGYLNGMRTATMNDPPDQNVRSFRRPPPPR